MKPLELSNAADPVARSRGRPLADTVLELIWRERQISRAEIARRTGLSRSTVSEIVVALLATGLVAEVGDGPSRGGRRPIVLAFQDRACVILGIDMGATHVSAALTDLRGNVLAWRSQGHPVREDPVGTRALVRRLGDECLAEAGDGPHPLLGVGLAVPAPVDPRAPHRLPELVMPAWHGSSGIEELRNHFGVPVFVENDANLGAVAEHWWGGGRDLDDFTYVKVATGVGAGHVVRGEIYQGSTGVAGEIGHITIDPNGAPCVCGNRGCLTTVVGTQALVERASALRELFPDSPLASGPVTILRIEDAALADDPLALTVVSEAAENLGIVVSGVLNMMNPAAVILGGSMARLGERLLVPLREAVFRRTLVSSLAASQIRTSELGPRDVALGAATHVLASALADPSLFPRMQSP